MEGTDTTETVYTNAVVHSSHPNTFKPHQYFFHAFAITDMCKHKYMSKNKQMKSCTTNYTIYIRDSPKARRRYSLWTQFSVGCTSDGTRTPEGTN